MNSIETLRDGLKQRFPGGTFTLTAPVRAEDVWTLDIAHDGQYLVVEWTPPDRFGVSSASTEAAFGGGPDEVFVTADDALAHVTRFLAGSHRPSPPLPALLARVRTRCTTAVDRSAREAVMTSVVVELNTDQVGDLRAFRVTMSRVPCVGDVVRVLWTVHGRTTALWFKVTGITHNTNTEAYPRRPGELDAWVSCESRSPQW